MHYVIKQSGKVSDLIKKKKPLIMGILNITPDSFSDGEKYFHIDDAIDQAKKLIKERVDIIDVGGESTRPSAEPVSEEEEIRRVIPVIKWCRDAALQRLYKNILISIDTYKSKVAKAALDAGANMINDVSGLTKDPTMIKVARNADCPIVIMHNNGIPATKPEIRKNVEHSIIDEVYSWFKHQAEYAIANGIKPENIIIDPGIGFGKSAEEDLYLIECLYEFKSLGFPILVGSSRKSFIRKLFGEKNFGVKNKEMIELAIKNGTNIVRMH